QPLPPLANLLAEVEALVPAALDLTRRAVEINSYTANVAGVNAVGALLKTAFAWPALEHTRVAGAAFGDHLFWRTRTPGPAILLVGHHDTVFPPGHFEGWSVQGERATGPGALDMKGGLAVIWNALAALERLGLLEALPLLIASVGDEEVGSPESRPHLLERARGASCALVFESGRAGDSIVTRRRGTGTLTLRFEGRAAHAGNAHAAGRNALWAMARFIEAAQCMTDYARGSTVNVGLARGGTSSNTVPALAECSVDLRFERSADADALLEALHVTAQEAARSVGAQVSISGGANRMPLDRTPASVELYEEYAACARAAGLGAAEHELVGGGSDANTVATVGVPAIDGLGPRGEGFHTTAEWVDLASFRPKAAALARFLWQRLAALRAT
ncbi:MAG TPA: M20/M25/M40 family metallo-hydrolase, partial [Polyangiaceae bacterium]|nr:M20/M25/M40 family metallo-hydrolase [Polyangiaceae bacterium]